MTRMTLATMATVLASALATAGALAQVDYPTRHIQFMIPQAAGGSTDLLARTVGQKLASSIGQQVVAENRAGANGIIGCELVAKAAPDGHTLLVGGTGTMAINPTLYPKLSYDPVKGFSPVAMFGYSTSVLVVHPSVPAATIADVVGLAKAKPGQLKYASAGFGSSPHLSAEMFKLLAGIDLLHVPYKGSTPGVGATISGETEFMFTGVASALGHIRNGRLKALSINGPRRSPALPAVPTANESGMPGFEADFWIGLFAPAGTPRAVVLKLNAEVNKALAADDLRERLAAFGVDPLPGTPEQFGAILARDIERWAKTVRASGMKPE